MKSSVLLVRLPNIMLHVMMSRPTGILLASNILCSESKRCIYDYAGCLLVKFYDEYITYCFLW